MLGRVNTIQVNQEKDQIAASIMAEAAPDALRMFGITLDSIQLPSIDYDDRFKAAIGQANEAKMRIIQAQAQVDRLKVAAVGGPAFYVQSLQAQALNRWTGGVPQMVFGGDKGPQAYMPIPMPMPAQGAQAGGQGDATPGQGG